MEATEWIMLKSFAKNVTAERRLMELKAIALPHFLKKQKRKLLSALKINVNAQDQAVITKML